MPSSPRGSQPEDRSGNSKGKPDRTARGDITPPNPASTGHVRTASQNAIFMQQSITPIAKMGSADERSQLLPGAGGAGARSPGPGYGYLYSGYGGASGNGSLAPPQFEKRGSNASMNSQASNVCFLGVPAVTSLKQEPFKLVRYDPQEITSYR